MSELLYDTLVPWYRLYTPPEDYADEAASYRDAIRRTATGTVRTLLELGAGAGHNALHLKRDFDCTLTDLSPAMLAESARLNPDCGHVPGDMRTLRLGRTFDAVLLHDAVMYLTSEADLRAAFDTAFVHLRPGGALVVAPDFFRETFEPVTDFASREDGTRRMHVIETTFDPDPADTTVRTDFVFLLYDGDDVRTVLDRHVEGIFPRATWERLLRDAGFEVGTFRRPVDDEGGFDEPFACRKP